MNDTNRSDPFPIADSILIVRGERVLMDSTLAKLYGVPTKRFNEAVGRNIVRFPPDFMFQLTAVEWQALRSQIATLEQGRGKHRKYLPRVFTEHGALLAATILNSPNACEVSVYVVRAFVQQRKLLASNAELFAQLRKLEERMEARFGQHDRIISDILSAIRAMSQVKDPGTRPIGFLADSSSKVKGRRSSP